MDSDGQKGFVAITVVLFISGILIALIASSSIDSGIFFDQARAKTYRAMNYYYAYNCIDQAILSLAHDYFFDPPSPLYIEEYHCGILSVEKDGDLRLIKTIGNFKRADVFREAVVRIGDSGLEIVSID